MKPEFFITSAFKFDGSTLVLTEIRDLNGPAAYPTTFSPYAW